MSLQYLVRYLFFPCHLKPGSTATFIVPVIQTLVTLWLCSSSDLCLYQLGFILLMR